MMDSAEVIGFLAGLYNKEEKVLYIQVSDADRTISRVRSDTNNKRSIKSKRAILAFNATSLFR